MSRQPRMQSVLELLATGRKTAAEIAQVLGMEPGTVTTLLSQYRTRGLIEKGGQVNSRRRGGGASWWQLPGEREMPPPPRSERVRLDGPPVIAW